MKVIDELCRIDGTAQRQQMKDEANGLFTIDRLVEIIGDRYELHDGARQTLSKQLQEAANAGEIHPRHPHTDIPCKPNDAYTHYHLFHGTEIDAWFVDRGVKYRIGGSGPSPKREVHPNKVRAKEFSEYGKRNAKTMSRKRIPKAALEAIKKKVEAGDPVKTACDQVATETGLNADALRSAYNRKWKG